MSDSYQAVYDAIRSRFHFDGSGLIDAVSRMFDISWEKARVADEWQRAATEQQRPSVLFRPTLSVDGSHWCALYGEDLQHGVSGFGASPAEAMAAFDAAWWAALPQKTGAA